jgi:hypothetical protein
MANVPAMKVVLTAPRPGIRTPNLPEAFSIFAGLSITTIRLNQLGYCIKNFSY